MGCKAPDACRANQKQNFIGHFNEWQCRPGQPRPGPSVCRQCCQTSDDCFGDGNGYSLTGAASETYNDWNKNLLL